MVYELDDSMILNIKGVDYRCFVCNMSNNTTIKMLNNFKLNDKGTLSIWILIQIKHLLKKLKKFHLEEPTLEIFILILMVNGIENHGKTWIVKLKNIDQKYYCSNIMTLTLINIMLNVEHQ